MDYLPQEEVAKKKEETEELQKRLQEASAMLQPFLQFFSLFLLLRKFFLPTEGLHAKLNDKVQNFLSLAKPVPSIYGCILHLAPKL